MIKDEWVSVGEAIAVLGPDWKRFGNCISNYTATFRIYDGTEHPLAQKDKVIMNTTSMLKYLRER